MNIDELEAATTRRATSLTWPVAEDTSLIEVWMRSTKRLNDRPSAPNSSWPWMARRLVRSPSPSAMSCMARPMVSSGCIRKLISMPSKVMMISTAITMAMIAEVRNSLSIENAVS
ncbi:hypothetical protein D3C73_1297950 [compost metagenome]